jgi:hypothetical protein
MGNRRAAVAPDDRMRRFEQELEELADHLRLLPYVDYTQSKLASDLKKVRHAADKALKVLKPLQIVDSPEAPNFPLFHALLFGLNHLRAKRGLLPINDSNFPASVVSALIELQEAAETALITNRPRRGNAPLRTPKQAHIERAAMAFVLRYEAIFGDWPPKSMSGPAFDAMRNFLERLGYREDEDEVNVAGVLRRAVDREERAKNEREAWGRTRL